MKILNFGSLNIDYVYSVEHFVRKGETISSHQLEVFSGGKGLNQSVAMGRAGVEVYHAGAIGKDGENLLELLKEAGVNVDYVEVLEKTKSGNAIIQRDASGDNCIILYGGANQEISQEQVDNVLAHFSAGDFLVLQNEINEMPYIMEKAHQKGMKIVLNPSPMNEKILQMPLDFVDYFILNEIEAKEILGAAQDGKAEGKELLERLHQKFEKAKIVLTLGEEGSLYADEKERVCQGIYQTKVQDTTAAGDTYTGYFMAGVVAGLSIRECMDLAAKASAISVSRLGAAPSIPKMEEVRN